MATISVAIATFNEEKNIDLCLRSVQSWVDEIVLVDGGSTDKTVQRARKYTDKIHSTDNPIIFHLNKQKALDASKSEWVLQLDADEIVTEELKNEIHNVINGTGSKDGYFIPRKNYFLGHWLSKGGQYPDEVMRLFKKEKGRFPSRSVHEQIEIDGLVGHLNNPLIHNTNPTLADYWRKADSYTSLTALEMKNKNTKKNIINYFFYVVILPIKTFLLLFIRHKGFYDGVYGLLFALFSGLHHAIAYKKYLKMG